MVEVKIGVICVVGVMSVFRELGIRANPNNGSTIDDGLCSELEEELESQVAETMRLQRLESEQKVENIRLRHMLRNKDREIKKLKNKQGRLTMISALGNERRRLTTISALGNERRRLTTTHALQNERTTRGPQGARPVTATFITSLIHETDSQGITKVEDKIYVLYSNGNYVNYFRIYEDLIGFPFLRTITLSGIDWPMDVVYSNATKCVYIADGNARYIFVMTTTGEHRLTKWLKVAQAVSLALTKEGNLLVVGERQSSNRRSLEIYSLNGTLIRRLLLPQDMNNTLFHAVQTLDGNFIISHALDDTPNGPLEISQVTNGGLLINRYTHRNQSDNQFHPYHLSLDSENNRFFATDCYKNRVILFDSNALTWSQVIVQEDRTTFRLFYDASKKHLFVIPDPGNVSIYNIN